MEVCKNVGHALQEGRAIAGRPRVEIGLVHDTAWARVWGMGTGTGMGMGMGRHAV